MSNSHEIEVYVRFCETDSLGHVNNASFFFYFEEARTKFFEKLEVKRKSHPNSLNFMVASIKCDYIAQAYASQTLKVITDVTRIGTKSFTLRHVVIVEKTEKVIAEGSAVTVCYDFLEQKTIEIPSSLREKLEYRKALD